MKTAKTTDQITGIIYYANYEENFIVDNNFSTQALYDIMENDKEFVKLELFLDGVLISVDFSKRIHELISDLKICIRTNDWMGKCLVENTLSKLLKKPTQKALTKDSKASYWGPFEDDVYLNRTALQG